MTHIELINELAGKGFVAEDLFVVVRNGKPGVSRILKQTAGTPARIIRTLSCF